MLRLEEGARKALEELEKCKESHKGFDFRGFNSELSRFFPYIRESFGIPVTFFLNKVVIHFCMFQKFQRTCNISEMFLIVEDL